MAKRKLRIGTLFSGIGAFEHALNQLGINHEIKFACDNGERELPLKYGDLAVLTKGMTDEEIHNYCKDYINRIGVKVEFREIEIGLLNSLVHELNNYPQESPVVLKYMKSGRKSPAA